MTRRPGTHVVLFDLDGTLIDSAPDLAGAANELLRLHGRPERGLEDFRPVGGSGARGMLRVGFGLQPGDPEYEPLRAAFIEIYAQRMLRETRVFENVAPVLDALDGAGVRWGIVTNKAMRLAEPIVHGLGLAGRAAVLIGGDSTPHAKPHPAPLLEAARRMGTEAVRCAYVGDDLRDMQAGRAAGMATVAAAWGYLGEGANVHEWGADHVSPAPAGLLHWLGMP
jgi:phosphoglycolate phosphatase